MRFAYADPPYLGCARKHYGDATYDDPDSHRVLIRRLCDEYPDGWALSLHTPSLRVILPMCPDDCRIGAWVKPFCSFKPGVHPAYAWEPVIFRGGRKRSRKDPTPRDFHSENITLKKGLAGAKPPGFSRWLLDLLNVRADLGDTIDDVFPGTGSVLAAWQGLGVKAWSPAPPPPEEGTNDGTD